MIYENEVIESLIKAKVNNNCVLDVASGIEMRHPLIFINYFKKIYANEKAQLKGSIETRINESKIEYLWCEIEKIKHEEKYDLISFCWPEMIPYQFFIDQTVSLKKHLKDNGMIMFIYREEELKREEDEIALYLQKCFLFDHKQVYIKSSEIDEYLFEKGIQIRSSFYGNFCDNKGIKIKNINIAAINNVNEEYLSIEEKRRFIELVKNGIQPSIGKYRIIYCS